VCEARSAVKLRMQVSPSPLTDWESADLSLAIDEKCVKGKAIVAGTVGSLSCPAGRFGRFGLDVADYVRGQH
jgi:hypothetical protein